MQYRKCWAKGDSKLGGWHFIFDPRNKWVVFGHRKLTPRPYKFFRLLIGHFVQVQARAGKPESDAWLVIRWGKRSQT